MNWLLGKVFGNSLLRALVGLAFGVLITVFLFAMFIGGPEEELPMPVAEETSQETTMASGEVSQIFISNLPAPIMAADDDTVLGYVFLDITIDVIGDTARERAEAGVLTLRENLSTAMAEKGAGSEGSPGVVDIARLTDLFTGVIQSEIGPEFIAGVDVLTVDED